MIRNLRQDVAVGERRSSCRSDDSSKRKRAAGNGHATLPDLSQRGFRPVQGHSSAGGFSFVVLAAAGDHRMRQCKT